MHTNLTTDSSAVGTSSTIPAWVAGLSTASIRHDMTAADEHGTVTYSGLEKLFADLDAKLSHSKSSLTAAEMSDLKTIAANLNNGMSTSSYLVAITDALVDGNPANATWTGGAASSTKLRNLAVGSSATQLSELNEKWFLGGDLPSSTLVVDGTTSKISYSASTSPLFGPSGPSPSDVNQGNLGDCFLLSSLAEVAKKHPDMISSMFTDNGNNTYGVRFYVDGKADYVTVNNELVDDGVANTGKDIWASLAEKAFTQLQTGGDTGNFTNDGNSFSSIGNGGWQGYTLEALTGASQISWYYTHGTTWTMDTYDSSLKETGSTAGSSNTSVLAALASDLAKGDDVILGSCLDHTDKANGKTTLMADHAMSITGYDSATGMLVVRNPWGSAPNQNWETTFEIDLPTLFNDGDSITVDNVGDSVSKLTQAIASFSTPDAAVATHPVPAEAASAASPVLVPPLH
jgi:hypothetical protein